MYVNVILLFIYNKNCHIINEDAAPETYRQKCLLINTKN